MNKRYGGISYIFRHPVSKCLASVEFSHCVRVKTVSELSKMVYPKCCNPFKRTRHQNFKKGLRNVTLKMRQVFPTLPNNGMICSTCRIKIYKEKKRQQAEVSVAEPGSSGLSHGELNKFAEEVEHEVRTTVVQAVQTEPGRFALRITSDTALLDNIPCKESENIDQATNNKYTDKSKNSSCLNTSTSQDKVK